MSKPPATNRVRACIFCGSQERLSGEHVYANWLREFLPRRVKYTSHWVSQDGGDVKRGKLSRPGDPFSQRLRIVCKNCNSGWMSQLQTASKPFLVPLLQGEWPALDAPAQLAVARWITMTSMVIEFADPPTAEVPWTHRADFSETRSIQPNWHVWIGRHDPGSKHSAYFNHFGWHLLRSHKRLPFLRTYHLQTTTFTVGKLLSHVYMATPKRIASSFDPFDFGRTFALQPLVPFYGQVTSCPILAHDPSSVSEVSEHIAETFDLKPFRNENRV
jgi:hypothetical protein